MQKLKKPLQRDAQEVGPQPVEYCPDEHTRPEAAMLMRSMYSHCSCCNRSSGLPCCACFAGLFLGNLCDLRSGNRCSERLAEGSNSAKSPYFCEPPTYKMVARQADVPVWPGPPYVPKVAVTYL